MSIALTDFVVGDTGYVSTLNANNTTIENAINTILSALSGMASSAYITNLYTALFGTSVAVIDESGCVCTIVGANIEMTAGWCWLPGSNSVARQTSAPATILMGALGDATYYIHLTAAGSAYADTNSADAIYSVVKSGGSLGSLNKLAVDRFNLSEPLSVGHGGTGNTSLAANSVLYGNGTSAIGVVTDPAAAGRFLRSNSGSNPTWSTLFIPNTTTINRILFSSSSNNVGEISTANNGLLITSNTGVPSILAGPGVTGRVLISNAAAAPSWLATQNNAVLITNGSGVAAWSTTYPALTFDATITPTSNDGAALGSATVSWSDLFLASGGVINWNNGDVTITHNANALAFAGASSGYTVDAVFTPATNDAAALGSATVSWSDLFFASGGVINWNNGDVTITHSANALAFSGASNGYTVDAVVSPATNDGAALGSATVSWSDLFLASGGVVNWNNGDMTMTHSAGKLAISAGQLAVGGGVHPGFALSVRTTSGTSTLALIGRDNGTADECGLGFYDNDGTTIRSSMTASDGRVTWDAPSGFTLTLGTEFIVGSATPIGAAIGGAFQVVGEVPVRGSALMGLWSADANGPAFEFVKSRNATIGSSTIVQDNDVLGGFYWQPDDGTDFANTSAAFFCRVDDGSPAANDVGTEFVWRTQAGGGGVLSDRMILSPAGNLTLSTGALILATTASPTSGGTGVTGQVAWDGSYLYVCTATNTWRRVATTGGY